MSLKQIKMNKEMQERMAAAMPSVLEMIQDGKYEIDVEVDGNKLVFTKNGEPYIIDPGIQQQVKLFINIFTSINNNYGKEKANTGGTRDPGPK